MLDILRKHIEKVVPLTDEEFGLVSSHFIEKKFLRNHIIIHPGEKVKYNYYILRGLLKLVYTDESAKQHILAFAMEDWWESDFLAYYSQANSTFSLVCIEDSELLCLSLESYQAICETLPKMQTFFLEKTTYGFLAAQRRILSLLTNNAQERYERLIKQQPQLLQRVPKTSLASYLGVSRETLSRL
jgi:CRP-like cAMP-binding protein